MALPPRITFPRPPASLRSRAVRSAVLDVPSRPAEAAGEPDPLLTDLVSVWLTDADPGLTVDSHGTNTLTNTNGVTQAAGIIDEAGSFSRTSVQHLKRVSNAELQGGDRDFTFHCWVKPADIGATARTIFAKANGASTSYEYLLAIVSGAFRWTVYDGLTGAIGVVTTGAVVNDTVYRLCVWHSATDNQVGLRVDDAAAVTVATSGAAGVGAGDFSIGTRLDAPIANLSYSGLIDDVWRWNRLLDTTEQDRMFTKPRYADVASISPGGPGAGSLPEYMFVALQGQSNTGWNGAETGPNNEQVAIVTAQPYTNKMSVNGVYQPSMGGGETITSMVPLVPLANGPQPANGLADTASKRLISTVPGFDHTAKKLIVANSGAGGMAMINLSKTGTNKLNTYEWALRQIGLFKALSDAEETSLEVVASCFIHGESDGQGDNASYKANLKTYADDINVDFKAQTGQARNVWLIITQLQWDNLDAAGTSPVPQMQFDASKEHARICLACPTYILRRYEDLISVSPVTWDFMHHDALGAQVMGFYLGYALSHILATDSKFIPLQPQISSITHVAGEIGITFQVPGGTLAWDTEMVARAGNGLGFDVRTSGGAALTVTGVEIDAPTHVTISYTGGTAARVTYAMGSGSVSNRIGRYRGARGNLRCTQDLSASSVLDLGPLYHWCLAFSADVPAL